MNRTSDVELSWPGKRKEERQPIATDKPLMTVTEMEQYFYTSNSSSGEKNMLFWGDNLDVMRCLLAKGYRGKIDMIYIDPPFFSGVNFSIRAPNHSFKRAYKDSWKEGLSQYLDYMHQRLKCMHELLKDNGTLYVHLDWHVSHYVKILLDEIFGYENYRNQIIWKRLTYKQTQLKSYGVLHDVILYFTKGNEYTWNDIRVDYDDERLKKYFCWIETSDGQNMKLTKDQLEGSVEMPPGRRFALNPLINPNPNRPNLTYEFLGFTKVWKYTREKMQQYYDSGIIFQPSPGALPQKKQYLDESQGMKLNDIFTDIGGVMGGSTERLDFDTQKPIKLLDRLIRVSTNPGELIADFFSGSGTTLEAAQRSGRKWIGCELALAGINTSRRRLVNYAMSCSQEEKNLAFSIWESYYLEDVNWKQHEDQYAGFILSLYGASKPGEYPVGYGKRGDRLVYVCPLSRKMDTTSIKSIELNKIKENLTGIDILSRTWNLKITESLESIKMNKKEIKLVQVPPTNELKAILVGTASDILAFSKGSPLDKIPNIPFFELPLVNIKVIINHLNLEITIEDYKPSVIPNPHKVLDIMPNGTLLIEFLAIDWNHDGLCFKCDNAIVRPKKQSRSNIKATHTYPEPGVYHVAVMIVDAFGNWSWRYEQFTLQY